ncbi:MAG: MDR family MFS transporter [Bacteroidia bacterium]
MNIFKLYRDSFKGLRKEVWFLALITLVNRAGTMVIPFLSLYLTANFNYTLKEVGWIMTAFGLGSVTGAWLGGKLSDKIGFYPVMFWSLILSGLLFIWLQYLESFYSICIGVFVVMLVADVFRPAAFVAINAYSKPENRTRSVTLIRLAINLGFSVGPAVGGLIIATIGYGGLFWVDGITCIIAGLLFIALLSFKESKKEVTTVKKEHAVSPYKDKAYLLAVFCILLIGFAFLQYFSTIPLYYRDVHKLSEAQIGWLMGMNGFLIFLIEMPLVKYFERPKFSIYRILLWSTVMFAMSFWVLNLSNWVGILVVGMLLMTVAEMLNFPFLNAYALKRAEKGNSGDYMGLFTMAFSVAHILGHNSGLQLIAAFGYEITWYVMTGTLLLASLLFIWLKKLSRDETTTM